MIFSDEAVSEIQKAWEPYLTEFKEKIFPIYASYGLTFIEALMIYKMNELRNEVMDLEEAMKDDSDEWNKDK